LTRKNWDFFIGCVSILNDINLLGVHTNNTGCITWFNAISRVIASSLAMEMSHISVNNIFMIFPSKLWFVKSQNMVIGILHHYTITTDTLVTILNIVFVYGSMMASINENALFCPTRGLQFDTCNKKTIFTFIDKGSR